MGCAGAAADPPPNEHAGGARALERLDAPQIDRGMLPAQRADEVEELARREMGAQDGASLLVDALPGAVRQRGQLAVKAVVHDMPVGNTDALANPEALELFRDLPALAA